uniref:MYND-type domain-containing protein n=1 Tax=Chromera velia CCMP2878 TaxID=1169474 RepID=A0A0G4FRJ7_9ALVE|eukprot:Cvel_18411.t1-p1 / transcript=Cvel_18411.t1 / gene=Cvel_18411 / organism=Chromera_velia_CCMP2878 / gene_product=hypothetical protein / transcript_product=hypothetical protein / location=Cvel_scaffold1522:39506-41776(-) / protein_length=535 / sequence_SO=supercontig / SO=protein_coding / is_pseudo=false
MHLLIVWSLFVLLCEIARPQQQTLCGYCGRETAETKFGCPKCGKVHWCCEEHQQHSVPVHRQFCGESNCLAAGSEDRHFCYADETDASGCSYHQRPEYAHQSVLPPLLSELSRGTSLVAKFGFTYNNHSDKLSERHRCVVLGHLRRCFASDIGPQSAFLYTPVMDRLFDLYAGLDFNSMLSPVAMGAQESFGYWFFQRLIEAFLVYHEALVRDLPIEKRRVSEEVRLSGELPPMFITGVPRSGTSLLQNLLAAGPGFRTPLNWEFSFPAGHLSLSERIERYKRDKPGIVGDPRFADLQPLHPAECVQILRAGGMWPQVQALAADSSFKGFEEDPALQAAVTWYKARTYEAEKFNDTYELHKLAARLLEFQTSPPRRGWVFKDPIHYGSLERIADVYPGAVVVVVHRDLSEALTSWVTRYDSKEVQRAAVEIMAVGLEQRLEFRARLEAEDEKRVHFVDVNSEDLRTDPVGAISRLLSSIGGEIEEGHVEALSEFASRKMRKARDLKPVEGLTDPQSLRQRFSKYLERFPEDLRDT